MTSHPSPCMAAVIAVDASVVDDEDEDEDDSVFSDEDGDGITRKPGTNPINPPAEPFWLADPYAVNAPSPKVRVPPPFLIFEKSIMTLVNRQNVEDFMLTEQLT